MSGGIRGAYQQAFSGLPRRVWLLSAVTLIHRSGTMVLPFLTLYLTTARGMSVRTSGWFLALYGAGSVLGAVLGGRVSDRFGTVRAMQWTLAGAGAGFLALSAATQPWVIAVLLLATSIAAEGFRTPSSADLGTAAPAELRTRAFALRRLAINLGMAIGPALGGLLATVDYRLLFIVDGSTCLAALIAVTAWLTGAGVRPDSQHEGSRDDPGVDHGGREAPPRAPAAEPLAPSLWSDRTFVTVIVLAFLMNLAFAQFFGTYPLTMHDDFGYSEAVVGGLMAFNTILIVLFEMLLIQWLSGYRPLWVLAAGTLVLALGLAMVPFGSVVLLAVAAVAVVTIGEMLTHPVLEGFVANHVPARSIARAMGLLNATFAITMVLAPVLGTAVYALYGYRVVWFAAAGTTLAAALGFVVLAAGRSRRARS